MSEPFVGEIRMFAGNFAPRGHALCDGQLLAVAQNDALFSLLGTIYGGDGRTTFGLPDLRGRVPIHAGQGPGLSNRRLGNKGGLEAVTLAEAHMPAHSHRLQASTDLADPVSPQNAVTAQSALVDAYVEEDASAALHANAIQGAGGSQSHANLQPFLCLNFIIALIGIYPSRS